MQAAKAALLVLCCGLLQLCCASCRSVDLPATGNLSECVFVVDIRDITPERKLAASVAIGLLNRHFAKPAAIGLNSPSDWKWVSDVRSNLSAPCWVAASDADIVAYAVAVGAATATVGYSPEEPWALANVVALSGLKAAIPVPHLRDNFTGDAAPTKPAQMAAPRLVNIDGRPPRAGDIPEWKSLNLTIGLDAVDPSLSSLAGEDAFIGIRGVPVFDVLSGRWADELEATLWSWERLFSLCSRTDEVIAIQRPEVLSQGYLADYIVAEKMYVFFLPKMCSPGAQQVLYRALVAGAYEAGKQLRVLGYSIENEVVADCSIHHTEMSIVSDWSPNLSFFSKMSPISGPLHQIPVPRVPAYNPNHTYIAVVNSDGDNMQMENNGNRDGMDARVQLCAQKDSVCPPLAWTMSNQLATYAPFQLQWYYDQAQKTKRDTFLMGPSGFGFLHPAAIRSDSPILTEFVTNTVRAAEEFAMTGYVHWDIDSNGFASQRTNAFMAVPGGESRGASCGLHTSQDGQHQGRRALSTVAQPQESGQQDRHEQLEQQTGNYEGEIKGLESMTPETGESSAEGAGNSAARDAFILRYEGSPINTVFAPGEYNIPEWLGDVAGIQEQFRWGIEMSTEEAIQQANELQRGTVGYVYKIFNVAPKEYEEFGRSVADHVHILDYRQMHNIALQKKFAMSPTGG